MDNRQRLSHLLQTHAGVVVSASALILIALRVLALAKWDPVTATAIVQEVSGGNIALAAVVASASAVVAAGLGFVFVQVLSWTAERRLTQSRVALLGTTLLLGLLFVQLSALAVLLPLYGLCAALIYVGTRSDSMRPDQPSFTVDSNVGLGVAALVAVISTSLAGWLPTEALRVGDTKPFTGYVLASDSDETVVLDDHSRRVQRIKTDRVSRSICHTEGWWDERLLTLGADRYSECPRR